MFYLVFLFIFVCLFSGVLSAVPKDYVKLY